MGCCTLLRKAPNGFTLVEVMVALVITSLMVSILVSALYYMFRVQNSLQGEVVIRESDLRSKAWFADAIASCLPVDVAEGVPFAGAATEIKCETTAALSPAFKGAPALVVFSLKQGAGVMSLTYEEPARSPQKQYTLAEWMGGEAEFRFVDRNGEETDHWPKQVNDPEVLPRFVRLAVKAAEEPPLVWLVALHNEPWLDQLPRNPFGLDLLK